MIIEHIIVTKPIAKDAILKINVHVSINQSVIEMNGLKKYFIIEQDVQNTVRTVQTNLHSQICNMSF